MRGTMFGIGVGPGDPELLTLRAVRRIQECDIIAIPNKEKSACAAYRIVKKAVPEVEEKEIMCLPMPMTKDADALKMSHDAAAKAVAERLEEGKNVGFITLGDVGIYSTCSYLLDRLHESGYETRLECGIPSFCAAAARLGTPLVSGAEELHVIPAAYQVKDALSLSGVKVFMKAGKQMAAVKEKIAESGASAVMVENCGMDGERVFGSLEEIPEDTGYYCLMIVR